MFTLDLGYYLLGVFEGEGTVSPSRDRRNGNTTVNISVAMCELSILEMFQTRWGGRIFSKTLQPGARRRQWMWALRRAILQRPFLEHLSAHGLLKNRQAAIALRLVDSIQSRSRRGPGLGLTETEKATRAALGLDIARLNYSRAHGPTDRDFTPAGNLDLARPSGCCSLDSYLLGIFDGEGSVCPIYNPRTDINAISISVGLCELPILELFRERWGGGISLKPSKTSWRPQWLWSLRRSGLQIPMLEHLALHSRLKARQAVLALEIARRSAQKMRRMGQIERQRRAEIALAIRRLNYSRFNYEVIAT